MELLDCSPSLLVNVLFMVSVYVASWWIFVRTGTGTIDSWLIGSAIGTCVGGLLNIALSPLFCSYPHRRAHHETTFCIFD